MRILRTVLCLCAALLACWAAAHPANIAVTRAKVETNGDVSLDLRFDVLAYLVGEDPITVKDAPMLALLDGSESSLQALLEAAKKRFRQGLTLIGGKLDAITWPTAQEIRREAAAQAPDRIPVMTTIRARLHLLPPAYHVAFRFPKELGTVILSTQFPPLAAISEPVESGEQSRPLKVPTDSELKALAPAAEQPIQPTEAPAKPEDARAQVQAEYDLWSKAYMAHDVATLLSMLAPDYTIRTAKGATISHDEYRLMLEVRKKKHDDTTQYRTEIQRFTLQGTTAAVYSREFTTNQAPGGKAMRYQHDYIDAWVYSGGKWLLASTTTLVEQSTGG